MHESCAMVGSIATADYNFMKNNLLFFLIFCFSNSQSLAVGSALIPTGENLHELESKARDGDLVAAEAVGRLYMVGLPPYVARNISKAIIFLEPVAEQGDGAVQELVANAGASSVIV